MAGIYVLLDFHPYLDNPMFVRTLKDIAQDYKKCARTLVLISHEVKLPQELEHLAARFSLQHAGQGRTAGHRHEDGARVGAEDTAACRAST